MINFWEVKKKKIIPSNQTGSAIFIEIAQSGKQLVWSGEGNK